MVKSDSKKRVYRLVSVVLILNERHVISYEWPNSTQLTWHPLSTNNLETRLLFSLQYLLSIGVEITLFVKERKKNPKPNQNNRMSVSGFISFRTEQILAFTNKIMVEYFCHLHERTITAYNIVMLTCNWFMAAGSIIMSACQHVR